MSFNDDEKTCKPVYRINPFTHNSLFPKQRPALDGAGYDGRVLEMTTADLYPKRCPRPSSTRRFPIDVKKPSSVRSRVKDYVETSRTTWLREGMYEGIKAAMRSVLNVHHPCRSSCVKRDCYSG